MKAVLLLTSAASRRVLGTPAGGRSSRSEAPSPPVPGTLGGHSPHLSRRRALPASLIGALGIRQPLRQVLPALMLAGILAAGPSCAPKSHKAPASGPVVSVEKLSNGMDVVLVQNRSAPMICSTVIVKAGVIHETPELNGASHMLEHLLFNGTAKRTQEELYDEVDFYGGYNNATTRADHTLFQMLMPAEHIEHGLDVQADMLFNSTLPLEKLEKERGIVIEEIGKDEDDPGYAAGLFFDKVFYGDSPMGMPALGSRETVSSMSREAIAAYYHRYYTPENMVALVMGDFEIKEMTALMERYFGSTRTSGREQAGGSAAATPPFAKPGSAPAEEEPRQGRESARRPEERAAESAGAGPSAPPAAQERTPWRSYELHTKRLDADRNYIQVSWPAPGWDGVEAPALSMLEWLLNSGPVSALDRTLADGDRHLALHAGAGYGAYSHGGIFSLWAQSPTETDPKAVISEMLGVLAHVAAGGPGDEEYRGAVVSMATQDIYYLERMHYYGMLKAPMLTVLTPQEFAGRITSPVTASQSDVAAAARKLMSEPFVACAAGPTLSEDVEALGYAPPSFESANRTATTAPIDLSPAGEPIASERSERRLAIEGGPVLIVKQNPDSRVFATHVLVRDRAAHEPHGKAGIADMLHRLLPAGTAEKDRTELERELSSIGAQLKVTDNPYIPYDDYYFVPEFSYLRLDTIDLFYRKALNLLAEILTKPALDEAEIDRVRRDMLAAAGKASGSTRSTARRMFYGALLEGTPLANPPGGTAASIAAITRDDLLAFQAEYLRPSNLIISVVGDIQADSVISAVKEAFGLPVARGEPSGAARRQAAAPASKKLGLVPAPTEGRTVSEKMGKGQSYIYMGFTFQPMENDEPALAVMTRILSNRMAFEIRERRGLAYSVGASLALRPQGARLVASMGTRPQNLDAARNAMVESIRDMAEAMVPEEEVERTVNSMLGRYLMRTLFSMGQAYYAGLAEFYGPGRQGGGLMARVKSVTPADVERVASQYLSTDHLLVVVVQ